MWLLWSSTESKEQLHTYIAIFHVTRQSSLLCMYWTKSMWRGGTEGETIYKPRQCHRCAQFIIMLL